MKLLIVDDDNSLCEMYTMLFSGKGYDVKTCNEGLSAITEVADFQPDIVLLDILMPEMNGYQFLDALSNNTSLDPVVIIFSNLSEQVEVDRSLQHGADGYLQKSDYVGHDLLDAVNRIYMEALQKRQKKAAA